MDTKLDFKIKTVVENYEVVGSGRMIQTPCQIGEWWVMPAQDYQGKIPPDIQKKMFEFLNRQVPFQGFLVAEDMREIEGKKEQKPEPPKKIQTGSGDTLSDIIKMIAGVLFFLPALIFDPMLIAVLADGRWICVGTWYE
jgi:hypothetical protein